MPKSPKASDALRPTITAPPIVGRAPGGPSALRHSTRIAPTRHERHGQGLYFLLETIRRLNRKNSE
jgi:hypothetical protein